MRKYLYMSSAEVMIVALRVKAAKGEELALSFSMLCLRYSLPPTLEATSAPDKKG